MDDSTASPTDLIALIRQLVDHLGLGDGSPGEPLETLTGALRSAIDSFLGLELVMLTDGHPVRLSLFDPGAERQIATSLHLPVRVLFVGEPTGGRVDPASALTLYATAPGAFVDLAADLDYVLRLPSTSSDPDLTLALDDHLDPVSLLSGVSGLKEFSVINTVVGVLIERGRLPADAVAELRRQAEADGVDSFTYASRFLDDLAAGGPRDEDG